MRLKLSQVIGVDMRRQILTTNVWVEQEWADYKLAWNPEAYGGVKYLHVPSQDIWLPDIVLYNNADGNYEVTIMTKAILHYNGKVVWNPPAIYKSSCEIDVEFFPFDEQKCFMKFGSWTYDGYMVDLRHLSQKGNNNNVRLGMDLQEYYISTEWDVMSVPAIRNEKYYPCCEEPYIDITFTVGLRRKSLFYTVNVILPCVGISFLSVLVFYLPSDSGEKVSLSISILLSLTVFFLLLAEIIPPTSLVVPLLGKFVLFTMILDTFSICVTVVVLNVHFRSPQTHTMAPWVRRVFIHILPRLLVMRRPGNHESTVIKEDTDKKIVECETALKSGEYKNCHAIQDFGKNPPGFERTMYDDFGVLISHKLDFDDNVMLNNQLSCSEIYRALDGVRYIAECTKREEDSNKVKEDWKYVAMVLDRLFLWIFTVAVLVGSAGIILQAPALYDTRAAIDIKYSEIEAATAKPLSEQKKYKLNM